MPLQNENTVYLDPRGPCWFTVERYMPNATHAEKEQAVQNLRGYYEVLLRIATRRAEEDWARGVRPKVRHEPQK